MGDTKFAYFTSYSSSYLRILYPSLDIIWVWLRPVSNQPNNQAEIPSLYPHAFYLFFMIHDPSMSLAGKPMCQTPPPPTTRAPAAVSEPAWWVHMSVEWSVHIHKMHVFAPTSPVHDGPPASNDACYHVHVCSSPCKRRRHGDGRGGHLGPRVLLRDLQCLPLLSTET